ncbi:MAG TPA: hypothetical protein VFT22_09500 [Kofleriaceae bacterium]|nr:hypothetical protein [Kofleriaceae bacterium]
MANAMDSLPRSNVAASASRTDVRRAHHVSRRAQIDLWLALSGLLSGLLALPLAQSTWHGPEVAAVLVVSATALFAGQRWAIALIVVADLFLLPTVWPRAFLEGDLISRVVALATLAAIVPGVLAMRRAATVLVVMAGQRRSPVLCRRVHTGLMAIGVIALVVPLL